VTQYDDKIMHGRKWNYLLSYFPDQKMAKLYRLPLTEGMAAQVFELDSDDMNAAVTAAQEWIAANEK
jgi:type II secretory pathway component GspD/PulD (secretin)